MVPIIYTVKTPNKRFAITVLIDSQITNFRLVLYNRNAINIPRNKNHWVTHVTAQSLIQKLKGKIKPSTYSAMDNDPTMIQLVVKDWVHVISASFVFFRIVRYATATPTTYTRALI
jgi:hypothetical protein